MIVTEIKTPQTVPEALAALAKKPELVVYAGGTALLANQRARNLELPPELLCVYALPELKATNLTERFIELGAAVTFAEALDLGERALSPVVYQALQQVATPAVRNLATIGGNLSVESRFMGLFATLSALEAIAEFRKAGSSRWINVNWLIDIDGSPHKQSGELLTRIRIPLDAWHAWEVRRLGNPGYPGEHDASLAFLARFDKQAVSDARVCLAGKRAYRARGVETSLAGRRLPLSDKEKQQMTQQFRDGCVDSGFDPVDADRARVLLDSLLDRLLER